MIFPHQTSAAPALDRCLRRCTHRFPRILPPRFKTRAFVSRGQTVVDFSWSSTTQGHVRTNFVVPTAIQMKLSNEVLPAKWHGLKPAPAMLCHSHSPGRPLYRLPVNETNSGISWPLTPYRLHASFPPHPTSHFFTYTCKIGLFRRFQAFSASQLCCRFGGQNG